MPCLPLPTSSRRLIVAAAVLVTHAVIAGCPTPEDPDPPPPPPTQELELGPPQQVVSTEVPAAGDTLVIEDGVLAGFSIEVPEDAYADDVTVDVHVQDILAHPFGDNVNPLTPLVSVETDGGLAEAAMIVTLPIELPAGHFAMAFFVDEERGTLEGMPMLGLSDTELVTATRHFSKFLVASVEEETLLAATDSGFLHGEDNWQFTNRGSWPASGGYCAGQSLSMIWYYLERHNKPPGAPALFGLWDNEGDLDFPTPGFDFDDARGIRMASSIQRKVNWAAQQRIQERIFQRFTPDTRHTLHAFAFAMLVTGEPQYVSMRAPAGWHAVVVYRKAAVDAEQIVEVGEAPPLVWTCAMAHFDADDGCHCGCGVADPDCTDDEVEACDTCDAPGSCSFTSDSNEATDECPGTINPLYNAACAGVPAPSVTTRTVYGPALLYISDPNFPQAEEDDRVLVFDNNNGEWLPYPGGLNSRNLGMMFYEFYYQGWTALIDFDVLEAEYAKLELDSVGDDLFPDYNLRWEETNAGGSGALPASVTTADRDLEVVAYRDPIDNVLMRVTVYDDALWPTGTRTFVNEVRVRLTEEHTRLGVLLEGWVPSSADPTRGSYEYVDFHWFDVEYTAPAPGAPVLLNSFDIPSEPRDVALRGEYLFIADMEPGMRIAVNPGLGATVHAVPELSGWGYGRSVTPSLDGNYAWLTAGSFKIINVQDPAAMAVVGGYGFSADLKDHVAVDDQVAFVVGNYSYQDSSVIGAIDLTDPEDVDKARGMGGLEIEDYLRSLALTEDGNYAITTGEYGEVYVVDVSDPSSFSLAATYEGVGAGWGIVRVQGDRAYVAGPGLRVFDISDPYTPTLLNPYGEYDNSARDLWVDGDKVYVVGPKSGGNGYFAVLDVSDLSERAVWVHSLELSDGTPTTLWVEGDRAYVGESISGDPLTGRISIIDVDG